MSDNKSYRIKANIGQDSVLNVNLNQDFKTFEILSLKFDSENLYKFHTSNYGCVTGRVLANGNFGIPNAKISIFIKATDEDLSDAILSYLYPYKNTRTKNDEGIRYNLLPDQQLSDCHRNVGTFPNKRLVLDDNNVFEVYDKYYKYTTRSNDAGDYMIFGVPVGEQTMHVDIDLSDIGILSQRPRDMVYKGYSVTQFENANMFKTSTDLDSLTQIISQNSNVYVYPFWGEKNEGDVAITRKDIEIQYTFEPTCVFIGSMITDEKSNAISKNCVPSERMGKMDRLTAGSGTIEMIRKKPDGSVEELIVQGNQLIDGNGVWCYQIPMNLDYVRTDEYGNIVPTDDPKKGIATRARVRFRMSITEFETGGQFSHAAKTLVPNNPQSEEDLDYVFGTNTLDDEFATKSYRDLFWNQVYSVKSYIPRFQQRNYNRNKRFTGIKMVNANNSNNPIPYNNMRIDISFLFGLQCAIFHILLWIVGIYNNFMYHFWNGLRQIGFSFLSFSWWPFRTWADERFRCLYIGDSFCPDLEGWYFAPKCRPDTAIYDNVWNSIKGTNEDLPEDTKSIENANKETNSKVCLTSNIDYFVQCIEINLAMEYDVIKFDFYNDWINGAIYSPRWNADIRKKRSYLFGLIKINPRLNACSEENFNSTRRMVQQCSMQYKWDNEKNSFTKNITANGCVNGLQKQRCHKAKGRRSINIFGSNGGVVHKEQTLIGENVYYYKPCEWRDGTKIPFFATDIILLGSLNENDIQGIPQTFRKIPSSTYQLPDTLAGTNIGAEGFLYGVDGSVCNGQKLEGNKGISVETVEGNFDNVLIYTEGRDDYDEEPYDDPKPITETSGIDWGFSGPDQGKSSFSELYFPGGHFLGISCFDSEANIKSCVNLTRVCELGSTISHRQSFVAKKGTNNYQYVYTIPTGMISGDEILDYTCKNEFATLNYNGLKTRYNKENNLLEYDFKTVFPINFNGEIKEQIDNNKYIREYNALTNEFIRTIEESSTDYYRFRMGVSNNETKNEIRKKYLYSAGDIVSLPVYANSFYFYFGIQNGNTAIDKFYKDFFAECPKSSLYEPVVKITSEDGEACNTNVSGETYGKIQIYTMGVSSPSYSIDEGNIIPFDDGTTVEIDNVISGIKHIINVNGENINTVYKEIEIGIKIPEDFSTIEYEITDFTDGAYYTSFNFSDICDTSITGNIKIKNCNIGTNIGNIVAVLISDKNHYHYLYKGDLSITLPSSFSRKTEIKYGNIPGNINKCYLWNGNVDYDVYLMKICDDGSYSSWIKYTSFTVLMPIIPDIIFDKSNDATYEKVIKGWIGNDSARQKNIEEIVDEQNDDNVTDEIRYSIKKALFFNNSKYYPEKTDSVGITVTNPDESRPIVLSGAEETIIYDGKTLLRYSNDMTLDFSALENVYIPTKFFPRHYNKNCYVVPQKLLSVYALANYFMNWNEKNIKNCYFKDYEIFGDVTNLNDKKSSYKISYNNDYFRFNSVYLPFFFKAVFVRTPRIGYVTLSIANAIKNNAEEKYDITINGENVNKRYLHTEYVTLSQINSEFNNYEKQYDLEDIYPVDIVANFFNGKPMPIATNITETINSYNISITDCAGRSLKKSVNVYFIGDKFDDETLRPFVSEAQNKIRYYVVEKKFMSENYYTSYYLRNTNGVSKNLLSNKNKVFNVEKNRTFTSPYFSKWDIGYWEREGEQGDQGGQGTQWRFITGTDYTAFKDWPQYINKDSSLSRNYKMWSGWQILDPDYGYGSYWLEEKDEENELFGRIDFSSDEYCVIGVYDTCYHSTTGSRPGIENYINGDTLNSSFVIIREYEIREFDNFRFELGLIGADERN